MTIFYYIVVAASLRHTVSAFAGKSSRPSFSSFMSNVASSVLGGSPGPNADVDKALHQLAAVPSWEQIRDTLHTKQTVEEKRFRQDIEKGYGIGSPLHKLRLFDASNKEDNVRVTFYRDSASWCPYCQKVWITLEEKRIPYRVEKVNMRCYGDKPASFTKMQPSGQIPVAEIDGRVFGQSNEILFQLEQAFPEYKSLQPPVGMEKRAQELLRLERTVFSAWLSWLTSSPRNKQQFVETLQRVEDALRKSPGSFFMGDDITIVDIQFAPFLERMAASMLYFKGFEIRLPRDESSAYPNINAWFDAMEGLDSYRLTKSDYYTHCWDLPPQLGGCIEEPAGEPFRKAINGERTLDNSQGSWELPLQSHNGGAEPDWEWASKNCNLEATERISANHEAIVKFAARGAGQKALSMFSAPLADPTATPSTAVQVSVDTVLRVVALSMIDSEVSLMPVLEDVVRTIHSKGGEGFSSGVVDSLSYLRDRIGVPRDMKLPAARVLRAHLNWAIGHILEEQSKSAK